MSKEIIKVESFSVKCRWCLEDFQRGDNPVTIDGAKEKLFYDLTKIEVKALILLIEILLTSCVHFTILACGIASFIIANLSAM